MRFFWRPSYQQGDRTGEVNVKFGLITENLALLKLKKKTHSTNKTESSHDAASLAVRFEMILPI